MAGSPKATNPSARRREIMCFLRHMVVIEPPLFCVVTEAAGGDQHDRPATKGTPMPVKVHALDHLVINVADVARSTAWYQSILGMEVVVFDPGHGKAKRTSLVFGHQKINVRPKDADKVEWFTADHECVGSDDLCFLT